VFTGSFPNARLEGETLAVAPEVELMVSVIEAFPVPVPLVALNVTVAVPRTWVSLRSTPCLRSP